MMNAIISMEEYFRFSKGIFSFVGFNNYFMPYEVEERKNGKTSWSINKLMKYAKDGIMSFTVKPLKLAYFFGIFTFLVSVIYIMIKVTNKLNFSTEISQYPILIFLVLFFSSLQMILIGVLGEYIGKNYIQSLKRPIYIIKNRDETSR